MLSFLTPAALLALALTAPLETALVLPPSAAADFLAEAPPEAATPPNAHVPDWSSSAWQAAGPWDAWAAALETPDEPAARLHLMLNARALGRSEAAWGHFARLPRAWAEPLLVELLLAPTTNEGVTTLRPLLPPVPVIDAATWKGLPPKRIMTATGLNLGATQVALTVEVAPEGVEVRLTWQAGPPLDVLVQIPTPDDWKARLVYVDWDRTEPEPDGYALHLAPAEADDDPEHTLWARCEAERRTWPRLDDPRFPIPAPPVVLQTTPGDPDLPRLRQAATFLSKTLGLSVEVQTSRAAATHPAPGRTPLRIDLPPSDHRDLELRDLVTQAERVALARRVVEIPTPR